jgi:HSP20 family protein
MAMLTTYRDPLLTNPFRMMDELLRGSNGKGMTGGFTPPLDVHESEDEYLVLLDLPGVKPDEVTIEINDQVLTIAGARPATEQGAAQLSERPSGAFVRTLTLPKGVDENEVVANYNDGVLELHVPKPAEQRPKKITIGSGSQKTISQ